MFRVTRPTHCKNPQLEKNYEAFLVKSGFSACFQRNNPCFHFFAYFLKNV